MSKKIVICCDGTGNSFDNATEESNVVKFYSALSLDSGQIGYYHPGVGTMGDPGARSGLSKAFSQVKGLVAGAGLLDNVGDAYRYLMNTYADGDEIFLLGFSRGAFTARALASVLHVFGLLCSGNDGLIPYVLKMYAQRTRLAKRTHVTFPTDDLFGWQFSHSHQVRVHFCGLWDTVSSYGWFYDPIMLPFNGNNPIIDIGRHAVSIDERRCFYRDNLWGPPLRGQDFRQVWFAGVHADVGGSYPEDESGLSKIALEWMFVEVEKAGLRLDRSRAQAVLGRAIPFPKIDGMLTYVEPDENACRHDSLEGWWRLLEYVPQPFPDLKGRWVVPRGRRRTIPPGSLVHESVIQGKWKPADLPAEYRIEPYVPYPVRSA